MVRPTSGKATSGAANPVPLMGRASASDDADAGANTGVLDFFIKREQIFNDFVRAVGHYKLDAAQAQLAEAQAASQFERAAILDRARMQLYLDLEQLNSEAAATEKRINEIELKARYALHFLEGRPLSGSYGVVRESYKYFETRAMLERDDELFKPLALNGLTIRGKDFLDNYYPTKPCLDPESDDLRNLLTLISWTFRMQYLAKTGTSAQQQFVRLYKVIDSVASSTVDRLNAYIDQIRNRTYETWTPVIFAALETSNTARRVLENTGPNAMTAN